MQKVSGRLILLILVTTFLAVACDNWNTDKVTATTSGNARFMTPAVANLTKEAATSLVEQLVTDTLGSMMEDGAPESQINQTDSENKICQKGYFYLSFQPTILMSGNGDRTTQYTYEAKGLDDGSFRVATDATLKYAYYNINLTGISGSVGVTGASTYSETIYFDQTVTQLCSGIPAQSARLEIVMGGTVQLSDGLHATLEFNLHGDTNYYNPNEVPLRTAVGFELTGDASITTSNKESTYCTITKFAEKQTTTIECE